MYVDAAVGAFVPVTKPPKFVFDTPGTQTIIHQVHWIGPMASVAVGASFW
jgi:hypothetical protein